MPRAQQLTVFLLCSFSMHAMELIPITNHSSDLEIITDDLFAMSIVSRLDRQGRDALRLTNKKYFGLILSQDILTDNYINACKLGDVHRMTYLERLGWLPSHQEFANAIKNKKYCLAQWLIDKNKVVIWNAYCSNIREAVRMATVDEMIPVIKWLLDTRRPVLHHGEFLSGYHFSNNLVNTYPEAKKIVDIFVQYEKDEIERKAQETVHQRMIATACSGLSIAACYGPTTGYYHR